MSDGWAFGTLVARTFKVAAAIIVVVLLLFFGTAAGAGIFEGIGRPWREASPAPDAATEAPGEFMRDAVRASDRRCEAVTGTKRIATTNGVTHYAVRCADSGVWAVDVDSAGHVIVRTCQELGAATGLACGQF